MKKPSSLYTQFVYFGIYFLINTLLSAQSIQDLQKLKSEYEKFQKDKGSIQLPNTDIQEVDPVTGLPSRVQIAPYSPPPDEENLNDDRLKHYGYDFFIARDSLAFWENLPAHANYLLGPGDELIVSLWGETQLRETYVISRDGKIYDEKVGLLILSGKTIDEAKKYLKSQFGRVYATLNGPSQSSYIDISLGELRSINVNFVGQVKYPGVFPVHPFSTVITGLIQAGGVDTTGSLREIKIKRNGKLLNTIDLYDYFLEGSISTNIQLRDQDVVVIPPRLSTIIIDSAVVNPGIYESINGETVFDLIRAAGGPTYDASENIGIKKILPKNEREDGQIYKSHYVDLNATKLIPSHNGDHITVRHLFFELKQVEIIGQVKVPGIYNYYDGMTLIELLELGGGFEDPSFWKTVYHNQAEIIRRDPDSRYEKVININLNEIYEGSNNKDIQLQNLDRVIIHANLNYFEKENISITGEVNIPGAYPLIRDNETLQSILNRAGGYTTKALQNGIAIYRNQKYFDIKSSEDRLMRKSQTVSPETDKKTNESKVRVAWQNESITLMPGDSIVVKESTGTVNVSGEIYNPGFIEFRRGRSIRHYINAAGGITEMGNNKSIIVVYANGVVRPKRWYSSPSVEDGATIIVNEKPQEEPFDITQFATNWTSIISSMITAIVLSKQL